MLYATGARGLTVVELRPGSLGEYIAASMQEQVQGLGFRVQGLGFRV